MKRTALRGTFYVVLAVAVFAVIGGFSLATFTFGGFGFTPRQAGASGTASNSPSGLSFPLAEGQLVSASTTPAAGACTTSNLGTNLTPTVLTNGASTGICLSNKTGTGFVTGDSMWILEVAWNSSATPLSLFQLKVFIQTTPTINDVQETAYVMTSATISTNETAVLAVDLTESGDTSVGEFSVLVTEM
jgi:hypothetical protein